MKYPQFGLRRTIRLTECPAVGCEGPSLKPITKESSELYFDLGVVSQNRGFDYYHCNAGCYRIWRIERYDRIHGEFYREPQCIGYWNSDSDPKNWTIFQSPKTVSIKSKYYASKEDPTRPEGKGLTGNSFYIFS